MYTNLSVYNQNRIRTIVVNRESKLNALNKNTLYEINLVFTEALADNDVKGIIITGAGNRAFVAGADIAELKGLDKTEGYQLAFDAQVGVFDLIANSNKPVIAAINGFALGGGLELAMACHIRIASENARMGLPEVSLGLIPGYGGTQRLPMLVGKGKAFEIILTGEMLTAQNALSIGLVNLVVPQQDLLEKADLIMKKILSRSSNAVSAAIRAINASFSASGYEVEKQEFGLCFGSADFQEGTDAFLNKRTPNF